jgi:hypothetical protein
MASKMAEFGGFPNQTMNGTQNNTNNSTSQPMNQTKPEDSPETKKVKEMIKIEDSIIKNLQKQALANITLASLRLYRSTRCALCMDPDMIITEIYDGGV